MPSPLGWSAGPGASSSSLERGTPPPCAAGSTWGTGGRMPYTEDGHHYRRCRHCGVDRQGSSSGPNDGVMMASTGTGWR